MSMSSLLEALRAAGEPTRLRIIATLDHRELTVSELCEILDQSQPRISRHLKLLVDAGILERHSEGSNAFFRRARTGLGNELLAAIDPLIDLTDPEMLRDRERLDFIRRERAAVAEDFFNELASDWDRVRSLHVADETVEDALLGMIQDRDVDVLLDVGTGTARMLEIFADHIGAGLGIDISLPMLRMARSRLDAADITNCSVRQGSVYSLDLPDDSVDVVILHHVLHFLDEPKRAIIESARVLRANGQLLIVDFAPHSLEQLRTDYGHRRLGYEHTDVSQWCADAGLGGIGCTDLASDQPDESSLTTTIWSASSTKTSPTTLQRLETAS